MPSATMPAYRIVEWEQPPRLVEAPVPEPGPGEVLVAVAANGLCHSDLEMAKIPGEIGDMLGWRVPFTLGHEIAGHVAGVGAGVTGLSEGDAVALVSPASCGECPACRRGHDSVCPNGLAGRGYGRDGGLAPLRRGPGATGRRPARPARPRRRGPAHRCGGHQPPRGGAAWSPGWGTGRPSSSSAWVGWVRSRSSFSGR